MGIQGGRRKPAKWWEVVLFTAALFGFAWYMSYQAVRLLIFFHKQGWVK